MSPPLLTIPSGTGNLSAAVTLIIIIARRRIEVVDGARTVLMCVGVWETIIMGDEEVANSMSQRR